MTLLRRRDARAKGGAIQKTGASSVALADAMHPIGGWAMALEPRTMFDAAGVLTGVEAVADDAARQAAEAHVATLSDSPDHEEADLAALFGDQVPVTFRSDDEAGDSGNAIVFIDAGVEDREVLAGYVRDGVEVVMLDSGQDALTQMADILEQRGTTYDSIHLVSHGDVGALDLSGGVLDSSTLDEHADTLARIGAALDEAGDLLLYGCRVGEGGQGQAFLDSVATLTGADVAASDDLTGVADQGGDWALEAVTGAVEAGLAFDAGVTAYASVLETPDFADDATTTGEVVVGDSVIGEIEFLGDADWIAVTLLPSRIYSFTMETEGSGGLQDAVLSLYDASEVLLLSDDDSGEGFAPSITFETDASPASNTYYIGVSAFSDASTGNYSVSVAWINRAPTDIALSTLTADENNSNFGAVATITSADADGLDKHDYVLAGVDADSFVVTDDGSSTKTLRVADGVVLDFEGGKTSYSITLTSTDTGGGTYVEDFVITVNDINEAPTSITLSNDTVVENDPEVTIGFLSSEDPDADDVTAFYEIVSDPSGKFHLSGNLLKLDLNESADFETAAFHDIVIRATDTQGAFSDITVRVNVQNVDEAVTDIALSNTVMTENVRGQDVGILSPVDVDSSASYTYEILSDASGLFEINGTVLKVIDGLAADFEESSSHSITIQVTDASGGTAQRTFSITVTDTTDPPKAVTLTDVFVTENVAGDTVGTLEAVDDDNPSDSHIFALVSDPSGKFEISGSTLRLRAGESTDFEAQNTYVVRVNVRDSVGFALQQDLVVQVVNVNEPHTDFSLVTSNVNENGNTGDIVTGFVHVDPDTVDTYTYEILDIADSSGIPFFAIDGTNLVINRLNFPDFETKDFWDITIRATDGGGTGVAIDKTFRLVVNDVNEPPRSLDLSNTLIPEDIPGAVVGDILINDQDANETFTYQLDGQFAQFFDVFQGQLKLIDGFAPNYEDNNGLISLLIGVTDSAGNVVERNFSLSIADLNDPPDGFVLLGGTVEENLSGLQFGQFQGDDPDISENFVFSILDDPSSSLEIINNELWVRAGSPLNFEAMPQFDIVVRMTDKGGESIDRTFTIRVSDANDSPFGITFEGTDQIKEGPAGGLLVGKLEALDEDRTDQHTFILFDGDGLEVFELVNGNEIRVKPGVVFDFETKREYRLLGAAIDQAGGATGGELIITIGDENEAPFLLNPASEIPAALEENLFVFQLPPGMFDDVDQGDKLTYEARLQDGRPLPSWLTFDTKNQRFVGTPSNDDVVIFQGMLHVEVTAEDRDGLVARQAFSIPLKDVNDDPILLAALQDLEAGIGQTFKYDYGRLVADFDFRDSLQFEFALGGSQSLPTWLDFNTTTGVLTGAPRSDSGGQSFELAFSAIDSRGASRTDVITLRVAEDGVIVGDLPPPALRPPPPLEGRPPPPVDGGPSPQVAFLRPENGLPLADVLGLGGAAPPTQVEPLFPDEEGVPSGSAGGDRWTALEGMIRDTLGPRPLVPPGADAPLSPPEGAEGPDTGLDDADGDDEDDVERLPFGALDGEFPGTEAPPPEMPLGPESGDRPTGAPPPGDQAEPRDQGEQDDSGEPVPLLPPQQGRLPGAAAEHVMDMSQADFSAQVAWQANRFERQQSSLMALFGADAA